MKTVTSASASMKGRSTPKAFNVSFEWLMIGSGPQWPRKPYLIHLAQQLSPESWQKILPTVEMIMVAALRNQVAAAEKAVERDRGERKKQAQDYRELDALIAEFIDRFEATAPLVTRLHELLSGLDPHR